jgi:hypothetical protein
MAQQELLVPQVQQENHKLLVLMVLQPLPVQQVLQVPLVNPKLRVQTVPQVLLALLALQVNPKLQAQQVPQALQVHQVQ